MREIRVHAIFLTSQMLGTLDEHARDKPDDQIVDPEIIRDQYEAIQQNLSECGLPVSHGLTELMLTYLDKKPPFLDFRQLKQQVHALSEAIFSELRTINFFRLNDEYVRYFEKPNLFGEKVALAFPSAASDIQEAGKCLALGRSTATVFHMMRVMEAGLKAIAKDLNIDYAPSWDSYIGKIEAQLAASHKTKTKKWKSAEPFYREVLGNLMAIKIAWRNPTMHMVRTYTLEEAEDVLRAVRTFMQRLAERLSQA